LHTQIYFYAAFQVRKVTLAYLEAAAFPAYLDLQAHLAVEVQTVFQDWMEVQVYLL